METHQHPRLYQLSASNSASTLDGDVLPAAHPYSYSYPQVAYLPGGTICQATTEAEHKVKGRLLLNVVVAKGAPVLELLASEDEALLIRGDALLVLNLLLHVVDRVAGLHIERDRLARQRLDEDLHAATEAEHKVKGRLLLNVVVAKGAPVLELLASEDEALLIRGDALLVLNLLLHVVDRVAGPHIERDRLARQRLDEDL